MNKDVTLSIVIPTYNDKSRFPKTFNAYKSFFDKKRIKYEIIFADYSRDGSREIIKEYESKFSNVRLLAISRRGKGVAIFEAFKIAKGNVLSFVDADNAVVPQEFWKLYSLVDRYDAVIGSRGLARSHVVNYHQSPFRRFGSFVLGIFFVHFLYGLSIRDTQCGAKVFRREKIMEVIPQMRIINSIFDIELLWRFNKIGTIKEMPIIWIDDKYSHFKWRDVISEFIWLVRVRAGL